MDAGENGAGQDADERANKGAGRRRIYLMRHGHVDYFDPAINDPRNVVLTDLGRRQALAAQSALAPIKFDFAVCSGLARTRETAEIVLGPHETVALQSENRLEELVSRFLIAESREELAARLAFCFDDAAEMDACFLPGGETFKAAETRITAALRDLIETKIWKTALIVAHEGVNRIILGWVCGGGLKTIGAFEQDLACVNVIDMDITPSPDGPGLQLERAIMKAVNITPYDYVKSGLSRTSLEHLFDVDFGGARPRARAR